MTVRFRTKVFVASLAAAAAALTIVTVVLAWQLRGEEYAFIERRLTDQAVLIAELLAQAPGLETGPAIDEEADRLAESISGRVTLIGPDGTVLGDSTLEGTALTAIENHLDRPEVGLARQRRLGVVERYSTTVGSDMLYAAVPARHPRIAYVRVALPLTDVAQQIRRVGSGALVAFALALPIAVVLTWFTSVVVSRRVQAIATVARRYGAGDLATPTYDYGTDELGAVARVMDASAQELRQRLDELSRDRARMEAILSGMVEGVLVVDRTGKIQLANRAVQQMLRVDASPAGRPYLEVIRHPEIAAQLTSALRGDPVANREFALTMQTPRTFIGRAAPVALSGGGGAVLVLHDITDLRRADQIRRDFVANVSHELRTPLTAIRGYVEALLDDTADATETRMFLQTIDRQSTRMVRLVTDLLRLARLDAKQEPLDRAHIDVRALFTGVADDLDPLIGAKAQDVRITVADDAASVEADPAKLHDIIRNLVENAANYAPHDTIIEIAAVREGEAVVITVADAGPGIPHEDLTRVFERFYRVDKSRARPGGTGLGLAIVKHLVELHGGAVAAGNRPGGGAVFTVTLPGG